MFYSLTGTVRRLTCPQIALDVDGVGYLASVPLPVWDGATDGTRMTLIVYTYVREDRLDLFGFATSEDRKLFAELLNLSGIGPKIALELLSIPRMLLATAIAEQDSGFLTDIKGIGRKTAEKLLVDLKSLGEKHPELFAVGVTPGESVPANIDRDAIAALATLGYDQRTIVDALKRIPKDVRKTEDRVSAALRSL